MIPFHVGPAPVRRLDDPTAAEIRARLRDDGMDTREIASLLFGPPVREDIVWNILAAADKPTAAMVQD